MSKNNNIDKLFEDSLGNAEFSPDSSAWENISQRLDNNPKSAVLRSRYKIFMSYAASIMVIAVTSLLLIRSCNNSLLVASNSTNEIIKSKENINITNAGKTISNKEIAEKSHDRNINELNQLIKESKTEVVNSNFEKSVKNETATKFTKKDIVTEETIVNSISEVRKENVFNSGSQSGITESSVIENNLVSGNFKTLANSALLENVYLTGLNYKPDVFKYRVASSSVQSSIDFTFGPSNNIGYGFMINDNPKKYKYLNSSLTNSYNYSLNYKFELNKFFLKSGFNLLNTGEVADLEITNRMNDTSGSFMNYTISQYYTYDSLDWWVDPNNPNDTVVIYKSVLNVDTTDSKWVRVDSVYKTKSSRVIESDLRYIELPFMLGYRYQFGSRLSLAVSGGVGLNIKAGDEGFYINEGELTKITKENSPYRNITYNMIINMSLQYKISSRLAIIAVPSYRRNLNSIYKEDFGVNRKYESYSLNFGVNYIID